MIHGVRHRPGFMDPKRPSGPRPQTGADKSTNSGVGMQLEDNFNLTKLRVLVVDDQVAVRRLLSGILSELGVGKIDEAPQGKEALAKAHDLPPDIIITDYIMNPIDGLELVRSVRSGEAELDPYTPIIMISGQADMGDVEKARDAGTNEFLVKPFSAKMVVCRLNSVINHPRPYIRSENFFGPDRRRRRLKPANDRRLKPYRYEERLRKKER